MNETAELLFDVGEEKLLTIGSVVERLRGEFPDISGFVGTRPRGTPRNLLILWASASSQDSTACTATRRCIRSADAGSQSETNWGAQSASESRSTMTIHSACLAAAL